MQHSSAVASFFDLADVGQEDFHEHSFIPPSAQA